MNPLNKIVSQLDDDGCYCCPTIAEESPLEPGVFLIPGGSVDMTPPDLEPGKAYKLNSEGSWAAVADFRAVALYLTSDGNPYVLGQARGDGDVYAGLGPLPDWLTTEPRPDAWSVWKAGAWLRDDEQLLESLKTTLCEEIDRVADSVRLTLTGDPLRVVEYERAAVEAQAYKDAGYVGDVPQTVKSWSEAKNLSSELAADEILSANAAWHNAIYAIRDVRLKGKEGVRQTDDENAARQTALIASETMLALATAGKEGN